MTDQFEPLIFAVSDWSQISWRSFTDDYSFVKEVIKRGAAKLPNFSSFGIEVFARLYSDPTRLPDEEITPESAWANKAHEQIEEVAEFEDLRARCKGDTFAAGVAAATFLGSIADGLPSPAQPIQDVPKLRRQVQTIYEIYTIEDSSEESSLPPEVQAQINELRQQGIESVDTAVDYAEQLDEMFLRDLIRTASNQANEAIDALTIQMEAFHWGKSNGPDPHAPAGKLKDKIAYAKMFQQSEKLRKIVENAGRMLLRAARKQRGKTLQLKTEIVGIETGDELMRLLPQEFVKLTMPDLQGLFATQLTEKTLMQYQLGAKETEVRGPICIALDSSGSMRGIPEIWSKGVCLALLRIATQQKRRCVVLHFGRCVYQINDFLPGAVNSLDLINSMDSFYNSTDTCWDIALDACIERIEGELKKADIVLITDGISYPADDWLTKYQQKQAQLDFTTWGVMIGNNDLTQLKRVAHKIIHLPDLGDDALIDDVFDI